MRINYSEEFPKTVRYKMGKLQKIVFDFFESGKPYAKLEFDEGEYKSSASARNGVNNAIGSLHLENSIKVKIINGEVWLLNIKLMEEDKKK